MTVGIDIEQCDDLPEVNDPRKEAFYRDHFTSAEIEYCLQRSNPRASFCGIWCAKEAAKKCEAQLLKLQAHEMEIGHDEYGRPFLVVRANGTEEIKSGCSISISHTRGLAMAVCVMNG